MSDETKDILVTLPVDLEAALRAEAKENHRSRTKQLVAILEERYQPKQSHPDTRERAWESLS